MSLDFINKWIGNKTDKINYWGGHKDMSEIMLDYIKPTYEAQTAADFVNNERERKLIEKRFHNDMDNITKLVMELAKDSKITYRQDRLNECIVHIEMYADPHHLIHYRFLDIKIPKFSNELVYSLKYYNIKFMSSATQPINTIEFKTYEDLADHITSKTIDFIKLNLDYLNKFIDLETQMCNDVTTEATLAQV